MISTKQTPRPVTARIRWARIALVAFAITPMLMGTALFAQEAATSRVVPETTEIIETPPLVKVPGDVDAEEAEENLLTLNFRQINIRELLSALSMQRALNIVMAKEVTMHDHGLGFIWRFIG